MRAMTRAGRSTWIAILVMSVTILTIGLSLSSARVLALWSASQDTQLPGYLTVRSSPATPEWKTLAPGETATWHIEASLGDAHESTLSLEVLAHGELINAGAFSAGITACEWWGCENPTVIREVAPLPATHSEVFTLATLRANEPRYITVDLTMNDAELLSHGSARIGLGLHASGDTPIPAGEDYSSALSTTGADMLALGMTAIGVTGVGVALLTLRRGRGERDG